MSNLKEETLQSNQLLDGVLLKVYRDQVRLPDGNDSVREWIDHPGAAAMVPLFEDGTTLLVEQFRYSPRRTFLEVPAGKIDEGDEDPRVVARREMEEETGWRAATLTRIGSTYPCIGYSNEIIHFFLAEDLEEGTFDPDHGEFLDVVSLPFDEALRRAAEGELKDMKTITALFFAAQFLERRDG